MGLPPLKLQIVNNEYQCDWRWVLSCILPEEMCFYKDFSNIF